MAYKRQFTLDFSKVKHWQDIHKVIKKDLKFPCYYGENLDALWDCLREMFYATIYIKGIYAVPKNEDCQRLLAKVLGVFRDAQKEFAEFMEIIFID